MSKHRRVHQQVETHCVIPGPLEGILPKMITHLGEDTRDRSQQHLDYYMDTELAEDMTVQQRTVRVRRGHSR